jgi:hypothetical protein
VPGIPRAGRIVRARSAPRRLPDALGQRGLGLTLASSAGSRVRSGATPPENDPAARRAKEFLAGAQARGQRRRSGCGQRREGGGRGGRRPKALGLVRRDGRRSWRVLGRLKPTEDGGGIDDRRLRVGVRGIERELELAVSARGRGGSTVGALRARRGARRRPVCGPGRPRCRGARDRGGHGRVERARELGERSATHGEEHGVGESLDEGVER